MTVSEFLSVPLSSDFLIGMEQLWHFLYSFIIVPPHFIHSALVLYNFF